MVQFQPMQLRFDGLAEFRRCGLPLRVQSVAEGIVLCLQRFHLLAGLPHVGLQFRSIQHQRLQLVPLGDEFCNAAHPMLLHEAVQQG